MLQLCYHSTLPKPVYSKMKSLAEDSIHYRDEECILNSRIWQSFTKQFLVWCLQLWTVMHLESTGYEKCASTETKRHLLLPFFSFKKQTNINCQFVGKKKGFHVRKDQLLYRFLYLIVFSFLLGPMALLSPVTSDTKTTAIFW